MHIVEKPDIRVQEILTIEELTRRAEAGDAHAQFRLGKDIIKTCGIIAGMPEAIEWYRRRASRAIWMLA